MHCRVSGGRRQNLTLGRAGVHLAYLEAEFFAQQTLNKVKPGLIINMIVVGGHDDRLRNVKSDLKNRVAVLLRSVA